MTTEPAVNQNLADGVHYRDSNAPHGPHNHAANEASAKVLAEKLDRFVNPGTSKTEMELVEEEMRRDQAEALRALGGGEVVGARDPRQEHRLKMRSAYDQYSWDGEPPITSATTEYKGTLDYIMYSVEKLTPRTILSLPNLEDILSEDPRELEMEVDISDGSRPPNAWQSRIPGSAASAASPGSPGSMGSSDSPFTPEEYSGVWPGSLEENPRKLNHYIPNDNFPSSHVSIMVEFEYLREGLESGWQTGAVEVE